MNMSVKTTAIHAHLQPNVNWSSIDVPEHDDIAHDLGVGLAALPASGSVALGSE
jgi:hypothetical protein